MDQKGVVIPFRVSASLASVPLRGGHWRQSLPEADWNCSGWGRGVPFWEGEKSLEAAGGHVPHLQRKKGPLPFGENEANMLEPSV